MNVKDRYARNIGPHIWDSEVKMVNKCTQCGTDISNLRDQEFCPKCGLPKYVDRDDKGHLIGYSRHLNSEVEFKTCFVCGCPNHPDAKYCRTCGSKIEKHAIDMDRHEWVDLGLSVIWSGENLKGYYKWKDILELESECHHEALSRATSLSFHYRSPIWDEDWKKLDTANKKWGKTWRMPTKEEFQELIDKCIWEKITIKHSSYDKLELVYKVTGPNGNYMYLPTTNVYGVNTGYMNSLPIHKYFFGSYWTSSQDEDYLAYTFNIIPQNFDNINDLYFKYKNKISQYELKVLEKCYYLHLTASNSWKISIVTKHPVEDLINSFGDSSYGRSEKEDIMKELWCHNLHRNGIFQSPLETFSAIRPVRNK